MFLKIEPAVQGEGWSMTASTSIRFDKTLSSPYSLKSPSSQEQNSAPSQCSSILSSPWYSLTLQTPCVDKKIIAIPSQARRHPLHVIYLFFLPLFGIARQCRSLVARQHPGRVTSLFFLPLFGTARACRGSVYTNS